MAFQKVLAQNNLAAATSTDVYTVGTGKIAKVYTINLCNISAAAITFRLSVAVAGAALDASQYLAYGTSIPANDSIKLDFPGGLCLGAADVIRAYASDTNLTVSIFGEEGKNS